MSNCVWTNKALNSVLCSSSGRECWIAIDMNRDEFEKPSKFKPTTQYPTTLASKPLASYKKAHPPPQPQPSKLLTYSRAHNRQISLSQASFQPKNSLTILLNSLHAIVCTPITLCIPTANGAYLCPVECCFYVYKKKCHS